MVVLFDTLECLYDFRTSYSFFKLSVSLFNWEICSAALDNHVVLHSFLVLLQGGEQQLHLSNDSVLMHGER